MAGAGLMVAATLVALIWANSPWGASYDRLWQTELAVRFAENVNAGLRLLVGAPGPLTCKRGRGAAAVALTSPAPTASGPNAPTDVAFCAWRERTCAGVSVG